MSSNLSSWNDTPAKRAVAEFVARVTDSGSADYVIEEERIAVFDNDGTLCCEKPAQIQLGFILQRLAEMAESDSSLRSKQPWQAAYEHDHSWFADVVTRHYEGDDSKVKVLLGGVLKAFGELTVEAFQDMANDFIRHTEHPTLKRPYTDTAFAPMVDLLGYLEAHGFTNYIVTGGGRDFIRPVAPELYGIPPERVVGSSVKLQLKERDESVSVVRQAEADILDDGPAKVVQIWDRTGRRPILAAGNANGDVPMLRYADSSGHLSMCILVKHDDAEREFDYTAGAQDALNAARERGWTVVSMKDDFASIFATRDRDTARTGRSSAGA